MFGREAQVGDEVLEVVLQAGDRRRVELAPLGCERLGPSPGDRLSGVAGLGVDVVEDRPELRLHLGLGMGRHLGDKVARPMDQTTLAQAVVEHDLGRADQARAAVGDDQERVAQSPGRQAAEEPGPGVVALRAARLQAQNTGFPAEVMPHATSTGSAGDPGCMRK